jgi:hypothetical protein
VLEQLTHLLRRSPRQAGLPRSRWWLAGIRQAVQGLHGYSLAGVWALLRRWRLRYRRGRHYLHSPDPDYDLKLAYVAAALTQAQTQPERVVLLYLDECTYYRRPSLGSSYALAASQQPLAVSGYQANRSRRVATVLNAISAATFSWQRAHFDAPTLLRFIQAVVAHYPQAQRIFIALDNWSPHFHPDLLLALQDSPVTLLRLPTYAPWTNPVEQFWRRLRQEVLHLHEFADDWLGLQAAVQRWLDQWGQPSDDLLHYVGLSPY